MTTQLAPDWVIHNLPPDIWQIVFGICVDEHATTPAFLLQPDYAPLVFCQICSTLRNYAINFPELWCRIGLHLDADRPSVPSTELINLFVRRAKSVPLSLYLDGCGIMPGENIPTHYVSATVSLLNNIPQAKHLQLNIEVLQLIVRANPWLLNLDLFGSSLARDKLEQLVIFISQDELFDETYLSPSISRLWQTNLPKLDTLVVRGPVEFNNLSLFRGLNLPYHQLTDITLGYNTPQNDFFSILSATTCLVSFKVKELNGPHPYDWEALSEQPIHLPHLRHLHLESFEFSYSRDIAEQIGPPVNHVLQYLKAPSLKTLHLIEDYDWCEKAFATFLRNSACQIERFVWGIEFTSEAKKLKCVKMLPYLKILRILTRGQRRIGFENTKFLGEVFFNGMKELDSSKESFEVCPNLETFHLNHDHTDGLPPSGFADMIELRWKPPIGCQRRLVHIMLCGIQPMPAHLPAVPSDLLRLLNMKEKGLDIVFRSYAIIASSMLD